MLRGTAIAPQSAAQHDIEYLPGTLYCRARNHARCGDTGCSNIAHHVAHSRAQRVHTARQSRVASANQLDDAGNRIFRPATGSRHASSAWSPQLAAVARASRCGFRRTEYVASLAMVRFSNPALAVHVTTCASRALSRAWPRHRLAGVAPSAGAPIAHVADDASRVHGRRSDADAGSRKRTIASTRLPFPATHRTACDPTWPKRSWLLDRRRHIAEQMRLPRRRAGSRKQRCVASAGCERGDARTSERPISFR